MKRAFTHGNIASPRAWSWNRLCHQRGPRAMQGPLPTSNAGPGILHPRSIATHVASLARSMVLESSLSSRGTDECRSFTHVDAGPYPTASRSIASPQHGLSTHVTLLVPQYGLSTPMLRASPEHGLRIISFITGLTNNAVPSRSIATPQHHVVISIATPQHGLNPT